MPIPHIPYEEYHIAWQGIDITIRYTPQWTHFSNMANIEIKRDDKGQLPISETGFHYDFISNTLIEDKGGPVEYVTGMLNEYALKKQWIDYLADQRQLKLF